MRNVGTACWRKCRRTLGFFWILLLSTTAGASGPWSLKQLSKAPRVYPAKTPQEAPLRALYYEGVPWKGRPTRVFAWYGAPANTGAGKLPAMVLVHGGGGTAFADWVKLWNDRGYAAIAMDTCGSVPTRGFGESGGAEKRPRHEFSGPPGWGASFSQTDWPVTDQWTYHAVADIILANSLLRSFPEVDARRIGITGISWGGYLTAIAASVDPRFRFAVPVYGCGFLGEDSVWMPDFEKMGAANAKKWLGQWDPSVYLRDAKMPFLWVDGTNDFAYPLDSLQKSYRLPRGPRTLAIRVRMPHGHGPGETPEEIHAFADHFLKRGAALASVTALRRNGNNAAASYRSKLPILKAELNYTRDSGVWEQRRWETLPADLDRTRHTVHGLLPEGTRVYYFNLIDERGLVVSSEHEMIQQ